MALTPYEALQTLMSGGGQLSSQTNPSVQLLQRSPNFRQRSPVPTEDYGFSGAVPTQGELGSDFEKEQLRRAGVAEAADRAQVADTEAANLKAILSGYGGTSNISRGDAGWSASGGPQIPAQRMAEAQRGIDLAKSRIPVEVAGVTGEAQRGVANIQGQTSRDVERLKEQAETARADAALKRMLGIQLPEDSTLKLPGGAEISRKSTPFPTGPAGVALDQAIKNRMDMETPASGLGAIGDFFMPTTDAEKAAAERQLDVQFPQWRSRVSAQSPGFKFATSGAPLPLTAPQAAPGATPGAGDAQVIAVLKAHGVPNPNPAQIQEAKRQLGIQ
jgi:hypothetical protein